MTNNPEYKPCSDIAWIENGDPHGYMQAGLDAVCLLPRVPVPSGPPQPAGAARLYFGRSFQSLMVTPARPLVLPVGLAAPLSASDKSAFIISGFKVTVVALNRNHSALKPPFAPAFT